MLLEDIPEFDYTLDDRVLEIGIFVERLEYVKDGIDVELDVPVVTLEYGWSTHEENEDIRNIIDVGLLTIQTITSRHSCEGGDWEQDETEHFDDWTALFKSITEDILDYWYIF